MSRKPEIWVATVADIPALVELKDRVARETYATLGTPSQLAEWLERFCSRAYFEERIGPEATFVGVGPRRRPMAMAAMKRREGKAYFGDIYCAVRRQGLGRMLIGELSRLAIAQGLKVAVGDVFSTNRAALSFIERFEFSHVSSYEEQSFKVPVYRFEKSL
jgi:L-amino acid N-acyltransferase YncA